MADGGNLVTIRDIDVPFWRIVLILIKWSVAAIPAMIVIGIIYTALFALLGGLFVGMMQMFGVPIPEVPTTPAP
jgi:hypothetical protein